MMEKFELPELKPGLGPFPPPAAGGKPELKFPLVVHYRVIMMKDRLDEDQLKLAVAAFKVIEPPMPAMSSSRNRYIAYSMAALVDSRDELRRLDATLRQVPGVRMVL